MGAVDVQVGAIARWCGVLGLGFRGFKGFLAISHRSGRGCHNTHTHAARLPCAFAVSTLSSCAFRTHTDPPPPTHTHTLATPPLTPSLPPFPSLPSASSPPREPFDGLNYHALLHAISMSKDPVRPAMPGEGVWDPGAEGEVDLGARVPGSRTAAGPRGEGGTRGPGRNPGVRVGPGAATCVLRCPPHWYLCLYHMGGECGQGLSAPPARMRRRAVPHAALRTHYRHVTHHHPTHAQTHVRAGIFNPPPPPTHAHESSSSHRQPRLGGPGAGRARARLDGSDDAVLVGGGGGAAALPAGGGGAGGHAGGGQGAEAGGQRLRGRRRTGGGEGEEVEERRGKEERRGEERRRTRRRRSRRRQEGQQQERGRSKLWTANMESGSHAEATTGPRPRLAGWRWYEVVFVFIFNTRPFGPWHMVL